MANKLKTQPYTWVEIDLKALKHNVSVLNKKLPKQTKFLAVIKGNAYGHGMLPVAQVLEPTTIDYFAVFDIQEAIQLRDAKLKKPILVLRSFLPNEISLALKYDLDIVVSTFELLNHLKKTKLTKPLRVHIMVDTGLGRDGFLLEQIDKVSALLFNNKNIDVVGLMSHFSGAESRMFDSYSAMQVTLIHVWKQQFEALGFNPLIHISATAGPFVAKAFTLDMVRFGIGLYGLWPSTETEELDHKQTILKPILSWCTYVNEVKMLQPGSYIGYNCTYRTKQEMKVAVIPVGYADGYPRSASNKGSVLIHGKRARILGRVMMNMMVVDITDIPKVTPGDRVTLIGKDKNSVMSAEELAEVAGTINYNITTTINSLIPRIYKS